MNQPDYDYFIHRKNFRQLSSCIFRIFHRIFHCAIEKNLSRIVLCQFGCGAFAGNYKEVINTIWIQQLKKYLDRNNSHLLHQRIVEISCFGIKLKNIPLLQDSLSAFYSTSYGRVPTVFETTFQQGTLQETLFVNAWDPWSFVGNGNAMDHSLDGYFGNSTSSSLLCWPITNPMIVYRQLDQ